MSARDGIQAKLERLKRNCAQLETCRQLNLESFLEDPTAQNQACYLLFTACQGALDIGTDLLSMQGLPKPDHEAAALAQLAEQDVCSETCVSQLTAMQGLCDSLSRQVEDIDPRWVYQTLQTNLDGLNLFVGQVQEFMGK